MKIATTIPYIVQFFTDGITIGSDSAKGFKLAFSQISCT